MSTRIGSTIGEYRIQSLLGEGATGRVYRATHLFRRHTVALKVLHEGTQGPGFKSQFFALAQSVTSLAHPNIAKVDHYGEDQNTFYIVTELVTGESLDAIFPEQPSDQWNDAIWGGVELVLQAADGLALAHSRGIAHGGIKPSNILVVRGAGGAMAARLTDIGVAKLLSDSKSQLAAVSNVAADQRSDVYYLGVALYELITRRALFRAVATGTGGTGQVTITHPGQLMRNFPPELESVILRCLTPDPSQQFATALDFSTALRSVVRKYDSARTRKTEVQPPQSARKVSFVPTPPPVPPPTRANNPAKVPCIQVLDASGASIETRFLAGGGITVGSSPENDVVLRSDQVSEKHVRLDWDGRRVLVTDLGSADGTHLDNHRLLPQVEQVWIPEKWLRAGPYFIWLETSDLEKGPDPLIDVVLDQVGKNMTLIPGKEAACRVTLVNRKSQVDHAYITMAGVPEEWVQGDNRDIYLQPFERSELELTINVPKAPSSLAKAYDVRIKANSRAHPTEPQGFAVASWTVAAFDDMHLEVKPPKARGYTRARYSVAIHNKGNYETNCRLRAIEEEELLEVKFRTETEDHRGEIQLPLKNGEKKTLKLHADAPRRWVGSSVPYPFTIQATTAEGKPAEIEEAEFIHKPVFPVWMLALAPVLLIGIVFLMLYWGKPQIPTISVQPQNPRVNETVQIGWATPRATRVQVLINDLAIPDLLPGERKYVFQGGFEKDTRIKVIAGNIFGDAPAKEITIAVRPPLPKNLPVIDMTVTATEITKGDSVTVRWDVKDAVSADFNMQGTVGMKGTYTDRPEANQTYTITAVNADRIETKKSFTVNVKEPSVRLGSLQLTASRPMAGVGETLVFTWSAPNAQAVRIDAVSPTQLTGTSGQKVVLFKGEGQYSFALVATDANNQELRSKPVQITAKCGFKIPVIQGCSKTLSLEWK